MKKLTKSALMLVTFLFLFAAVNGADDVKKSGAEKKEAKKEAKKDAKKEAKKEETKKEPATRLPNYFNQLGLTDNQKEKVRGISEKYQSQIADLKKQIDDLETKRDKKQETVLNDAQKKSLASFQAEGKKGGKSTVSRKNREQSGPGSLKAAGEKFKAANKAQQDAEKKAGEGSDKK